MYSSISRVASSSAVNNESVSSSDGGYNSPSAALNEGIAAITKPAVEERTAIRTKLMDRFQKGRTGGVVAAMPAGEAD